MHDWAGSGRKGAGLRAQVGRGMAGWVGLGSAPQKLDLWMPGEFQSVDQPQPAGLPHLVVISSWSENVLYRVLPERLEVVDN